MRPFKYSLTEHRLPKHLRAWTFDDLRRLRELAELGTSVTEIARALRRSRLAIYKRAQMHGIAVAGGGELRRRRS